jgi:hypothetical protein
MLHHAENDTKGGNWTFIAIANLMGAHSGSGHPSGNHNAIHFCTAVAQVWATAILLIQSQYPAFNDIVQLIQQRRSSDAAES